MLNNRNKPQNTGFSLIEILIALIVVSLTAVNITGLQKKVTEQQRDNIARTAMMSLVTGKMEQVLSLVNINQLSDLHDVSETNIDIANTKFSISWAISDVAAGFDHSGDFKQVMMDVSWLNAQGEVEDFKHAQQVNLTLLTSETNNASSSNPYAQTITSPIGLNEFIYFQPKLEYQQGAFVIHDSYLYQASAGYAMDLAHPHLVTDPDTGITSASEGWIGFGVIDDPALASNDDLAELFME